jgi:hypothetical protein
VALDEQGYADFVMAEQAFHSAMPHAWRVARTPRARPLDRSLRRAWRATEAMSFRARVRANRPALLGMLGACPVASP